MFNNMYLYSNHQKRKKNTFSKHQASFLRKKQRMIEIATRKNLPKSPHKQQDLNLLAVGRRDLESYYRSHSPKKTTQSHKNIQQNQKKRRFNQQSPKKKLNIVKSPVEKKNKNIKIKKKIETEQEQEKEKEKEKQEEQKKEEEKEKGKKNKKTTEKESGIENILIDEIIPKEQSGIISKSKGEQGNGVGLGKELEDEEKIELNSILENRKNHKYKEKDRQNITNKTYEDKDKRKEEQEELLEEETSKIITEPDQPDFVKKNFSGNQKEKKTSKKKSSTISSNTTRSKKKRSQIRKKRKKRRRKKKQKMESRLLVPESWPIIGSLQPKIIKFLEKVKLKNPSSRKRKHHETDSCFIQ
ncbi:hypothetical protein M0813_01081 [Anaeramoeba flamelloides]|uniref:Uncharacterized protein n=1 Tax=Anaeramoeba flamelloides TaxID=1746091 RepID=A0ABQ8X292_9EUKA|nr:hypothetical protein M0813_01081 [Anaeramoeba flamelloides]